MAFRLGTVIWALACIGTACGPTRSTQVIIEASAELAAAKTANAPEVSPYEYFAAEAYLHKAREEQSYADFETATRLGNKARDCARLARDRAEAGTRKQLGVDPQVSRAATACNSQRSPVSAPADKKAVTGEEEGDPSGEPADPPAKGGSP